MTPKNSKMTIEDLSEKIDHSIESLAVAIAKEFGHVAEQFSDVNKRFDNVNKRFDNVDKRFDNVDKRFDNVESNMNGLRQEFNAFRSETRENFRKLWGEITKINCRLDRIEKKTNEDTDLALFEIEKLKKRIAVLEQQLKTA